MLFSESFALGHFEVIGQGWSRTNL